MDIARKNHKSIDKITKTKKGIKESVIPTWFNKNIDIEEASNEERQAMDDLLKEYK